MVFFGEKNNVEPSQDDKKPKLEIEPSEVTKILPKCCEIDDHIKLLSEAYHLVYGGPKNLLNDFSNLAQVETPMKNTVLHIAALHGNDDIVTLIVEHAPKLLFKVNKNNDSVLHVAARGGHISTVKTLLATYADFKRAAIALAWLEYTGYEDDSEDYDNSENMEDLLYFVKKKNFQGNTMLHEAMLCGDKKSIDGDNNIFKICEVYTTKDRFGKSLSTCCYEYALDILNQAKKSVLYIAVENGDKDVVKLILEKWRPKIDAKPEGLSPVVAAIMKRNKEMLSMILENKPTWIHLSDKDERVPLHYAASIGYLEGVELLFGICKCCTILRDKYGYFPIHLASYGGHQPVVEKLLEYCPDSTEMLDIFYGHNILHIASNYGKYEVVRYILQSQNDEHHKMINQQDNNGDTPLHLAARSCLPKVVYYLVNNKRVELNLVNKNNKTALDIVGSFYKLDRSTLRQYLTWLALTSAGAKQSPARSLAPYINSKSSDDSNSLKTTGHVEESSQQNETEQSHDGEVITSPKKKKRNKKMSEPPPVDKDSDIYNKLTENVPDYTPPKNLFLSKGSTPYKDRVETLLLVSTLIVTASVAACFAVPGEAGDGKANNLCHTMFHLFIIFITISLFSAISSTIILFWATLGITELVTYSLNIVMYLLGIALISLSLAFMAGLYTVISELTWLADVFLFMTLSFLVVVIFLYMLFFVPSSSTNMLLRYISHYPYLFLASRAECQIDDDQEVPKNSIKKNKEDPN